MVWKFIGVTIYLAALLAIGVIASRRMKNVRDYYAGGKRLSFWAVAFSARATGESAWLLIGLTGLGAAVGVRAFWVVLGEVLGVLGAWVLMARRFKRLTDRYDAITVPDYLEARFQDAGHMLRIVSAGTLVVFVTIYVSAQIDATGTAFETFLGLNYFTGVLVGFGVVMIYAVSGGFLAVVWSDVFQGTLMFFGLVALPLGALVVIGGWGEALGQLERIDPALLSAAGSEGWTLPVVFSTVSLALIGLGFLGSPQVFVRFLALEDEKEIARGTLVAFLWTLIADSGAVLVGMFGRAMLHAPNRAMIGKDAVLGNGGQDVLPLLVESVFPAMIVGLYIAIVLSAIMSTVDSLLVVASSAAVRDGYQKVLHPTMADDQLVRRSRQATFGLAAVALGLALTVAVVSETRTVFWFVIFGWSGIAATFCPTMILSLYWERMTARGALAAMVTGFLCVPLFKFAVPELPRVGPLLAQLGELPPAFLISGAAGVVASLTDPRGRERLAEGAAADLEAASR